MMATESLGMGWERSVLADIVSVILAVISMRHVWINADTSKTYIQTAPDLVATFGFRGEGMAFCSAWFSLTIAYSYTLRCWCFLLRNCFEDFTFSGKLDCDYQGVHLSALFRSSSELSLGWKISIRWAFDALAARSSWNDCVHARYLLQRLWPFIEPEISLLFVGQLPLRRNTHVSPAKTLDAVRRDIETFALVFPTVSFSLEDISRSRSGLNGRVVAIKKVYISCTSAQVQLLILFVDGIGTCIVSKHSRAFLVSSMSLLPSQALPLVDKTFRTLTRFPRAKATWPSLDL